MPVVSVSETASLSAPAKAGAMTRYSEADSRGQTSASRALINREAAPAQRSTVSENPSIKRLLEKAVLLEQRSEVAGREEKLWRTNFKYPLIREDRWLDGQGKIIRRLFSVADHAMVKFPPTVSVQQVEKWAASKGYYLRHALRTTPVFLVATPEGSLDAAEKVMAAFRHDYPAGSKLVTAEKDWLVFPTLTPDDSSFGSLWGMHNTGQTGGVADADIDAPEAWNIATGSREVRVAVIDSGVDTAHPDLASNIWSNPGEIPGNGVDDDGNGFVDDVHGWDFFSGDAIPQDDEGHGTHCAGTIGAAGNNRAGVAGVCWQVSLVAIRFLGPDGGSTSDAIESVYYATSLGVDITSNSWGGGDESVLLEDAIRSSGEQDILFIAAAGNDGTDNELFPHFPSNYSVDNLISVASTAANDQRSDFSNYGKTLVDLAAPGSSILSTLPGGRYGYMSGTSMATPHVTGALALAKSIAPLLRAADLKRKLMETADVVPALQDYCVTGARLNAHRLLESAAGAYPLLTVTAVEELSGGNGDGIPNPGEKLALRLNLRNRGTQTATNVLARLVSSAGTETRLTLEKAEVDAGTLTPGQSAAGDLYFVVQADEGVVTPYVEPMSITLTYGSPTQLLVQPFDLRLYTSSKVSGRVTDMQSGAGLAGATVVLQGPGVTTASTAADGSYEVTVTDGNYQVSAKASGYMPSNTASVMAPPGAEGLNFTLGRPVVELAPSAISAEVLRGEQQVQEVRLANKGSLPLEWRLRLRSVPPLQENGGRRVLAVKTVTGEVPDAGENTRRLTEGVIPAASFTPSNLEGIAVGAVSTTLDRSVFLGDLRDRGATVTTLKLPLTAAGLEGLDVILLDDMLSVLSAAELEVLRAAIRAGAGLLCEADNPESVENALVLLQDTGVTPVAAATFRDLVLTDFLSHPVTAGLASMNVLAAGWTLDVMAPAQPLVREAGGKVYAAVSRLERGVIVVVGNEASHASNFVIGDGRRFANQIVDGLVAGPEWLSASPLTGTLVSGQETVLALTLDGRSVAGARHDAELILESNVPDAPAAIVPVRMNVREVPAFTPGTSTVEFGEVIERTPAAKEVTFGNEGTEDLVVQASVSPAGAFTVSPARVVVRAGGEGTLKVAFVPSAPLGAHSAEVHLETNDPRFPRVTLPVTGSHVAAPVVGVTPARIEVKLAQGQVATRVFTVKNTGKGPLKARAEIFLGNSPAGCMSIEGEPVLKLAPGKSGKVTVRFAAGVHWPGVFAGLLTVATDDPDRPQLSCPLYLLTSAAPVAEAEAVNFDKTYVGQKQTKRLRLLNTGDANLSLFAAKGLAAAFTPSIKLPLTLPPGGAVEMDVRFAPSKPGVLNSFLVFAANVPGGFVKVPVSGEGARPPTLKVTPSSLTLTANPGVPLTRMLQISNAGTERLDWTARVVGEAAAWLTAGAESSSLAAAGKVSLPLNFTTDQLVAKSHQASVEIISNDPARPRLVIPVVIKVASQGVLRAEPSPVQLGEVWARQPAEAGFSLKNVGNTDVEVKTVTSNKAEWVSRWKGPVLLAPGQSLQVGADFQPVKKQAYAGTVTVKSSSRVNGTLKVPVNAQVVEPPAAEVLPGSIAETVYPTRSKDVELTLSNPGGAALEWTAESTADVGSPESGGSLQQVLQRLDERHGSITALVPHLHALTEGQAGFSIVNGGADMYDTGNLISTNLNNGLPVSYLDGALGSSASLGADSRYFTRKLPGLFVLGARLSDVSVFRFRGHLGTTRSSASVQGGVIRRQGYAGFWKSVPGATGKPSVNHLVILPDSASLGHSYASDAGLDDHEVTGLPADTPLYALVFGSATGEQLTEGLAEQIMERFLSRVVHDVDAGWLQILDGSGQAASLGQSTLRVRLDAGVLAAGISRGKVRIRTNAPEVRVLEVPVSLSVASAPVLTVEPAAVEIPDTPVNGTSLVTLTLRNAGTAALTLNKVSVSDAAFKILDEVSPELAAGQSQTVRVSFSPLEARLYSSGIRVESNSEEGAAVVIPLTGKGIAAPLLRVTPETIALTTRPGVPASQDITLENVGTAPLSWTLGNNYTTMVFDTDSGTIPPGGRKVVKLTTVSLRSTPPGTLTQGIPLLSNDPKNPTRSLTYIRTILVEPVLEVQPIALNFGTVLLPGPASQSLSLRNTGNFLLVVSGVSSPSAALSVQQPAEFPLLVQPGESRVLQFTYAPSGVDTLTGELVFSSNQPGAPSTVVPVAGNAGYPPQLVVMPESVNVEVEEGQPFSTALTLQNPGGLPLLWNASAGPSGASWLNLGQTTGTVAAGGTAYLPVSLRTESLPLGRVQANVVLSSNASGEPARTVPVTVDVVPGELTVSTRLVETATLQGRAGPASVISLITRAGESPAWTLSADVPWVTPSLTAGQGAAEVQLAYSASLPAGVHTGQVRIQTANVSRVIQVKRSVAKAEYELLQTDRAHQRLLGLIRGKGGLPSFLAVLQPHNLAVQTVLSLPTDIVSMDATGNGKKLYAISFSANSLTEVDLDRLTVTATKPVTPGAQVGNFYQVQAGRDGRVFYTDAAMNPALHVYDFPSGADTAVFRLQGGAGIGAFAVAPDGRTLYARSQTNWQGTGVSYVAQVDGGLGIPVQTGASSAVLAQPSAFAPVLLSAGGQYGMTLDHFFSLRSLMAGEQGRVSQGRIMNASTYLDVWVEADRVVRAADGEVLHLLPAGTKATAFTPEEDALVYYHADEGVLKRLPLPGLPSVGIAYGIANGSVQGAGFTTLSWTGDPGMSAYDVYLGTDAEAVANASFAASPLFQASTTATYYMAPESGMVPGQTYYWRVDGRSEDGSLSKGPVWSFKIATAGVQPAELSAASKPGSSQSVQVQVTVKAAQGIGWRLAGGASWVSLGQSSGTGPATVTVTLDPTGLASGLWQTELSLASGGDAIRIPVKLEVLGALNVIKMVADPALPVVYALHRETARPFSSWLVWVDSQTGAVQDAVHVGQGAVDLACHRVDNRLAVLVDEGRKMQLVERQGGHALLSGYAMPSPQAGIHAGPPGRVFTLSTANVLQMRATATGAAVGASLQILGLESPLVVDAAGTSLYAAVRQGESNIGLVRYAATPSAVGFITASYFEGQLDGALLLAANGSRLIYDQRVFATSSLSAVSTLGLSALAVTPDGTQFLTSSAVHSVSVPAVPLVSLPEATEQLVVTPDGERIVLFSPASRTFVPVALPLP